MDARDSDRYKALTRRAMVLGGIKAGLFGVLAARLYWLQVVDAAQYQVLADENRINIRLLAPRRGRLVDRYGVELASNRQNLRALLIPDQTENVAGTLQAFSKIFPLTDVQRSRILREVRRTRGYVPLPVAENLTWEQFSAINVAAPELPGIQPDIGETRHYPYLDVLAHAVGYVGPVPEGLDEEDPLLQVPGFRIGKTGLEKAHDKILRGKAGNSRVEVNAYGQVVRELQRDPGVPGQELRLTLDLGLQQFMAARLGTESASAVVMDIHTGDVLGIASMPAFDPNAFNVGLSQADWNMLLKHDHKPLTNKAVAGTYPPGSTFKIITALAGLEAGVIDQHTHVVCPGKTTLGNHDFYCWRKGGHGTVDLHAAMRGSCDVYFYEVARRVGVDRLTEVAKRMGLGEKLLPDLPEERPGLLPTRAWKQATFNQAWSQGETLVAGIGQGYITASPLQLATMTARLANGGLAVRPRIIQAVDEKPLPVESWGETGFPQPMLELVKAAVLAATDEPGGTAYAARFDEGGARLAGKTGTSQVRRITKLERQTRVLTNAELPWHMRHHALYVGYTPHDTPRFACAVVVEHGGSGSGVAAPIGSDILRETLRRDRSRTASLCCGGNHAGLPHTGLANAGLANAGGRPPEDGQG